MCCVRPRDSNGDALAVGTPEYPSDLCELTIYGAGRTASFRFGFPLDGSGTNKTGSDFRTKIAWRALTVPGRPPAVTFLNGQAHSYEGTFNRYVWAVVRATRSMMHSPLRSAEPVGWHD